MQLLIFIAAIGFFVLRILASSKKKQPETAENGAANRFAENESDEFAFGTGFAQGKPKPAAQNRTEGRAYRRRKHAQQCILRQKNRSKPNGKENCGTAARRRSPTR